MPKKNVTRLNTPTKANKPTKASKPIATDKPEDLTEKGTPIKKPTDSSLDKFKSRHAAAIANVEVLPTALPHHKANEAQDFVRLHPDEENYWSPELCFVSVPIPGVKNPVLHLITEDLALKYLDGGRVKRFRLALASKPFNHFFLCHVPSRNLDNGYNQTNVEGCERAKTSWITLTSRKDEGVEKYKVTAAVDQDAFPDPNWLTRTLSDLIETTFAGLMIDHENHPGLLRLIGAKQKTS